MKCSKCGKDFTEPPAMSRIDNSPICPLCGSREALDAAVEAGAVTQEDADGVIEKISQLNNK